MPTSVHKLLIHAHEIIESCSLPIGMISEEALEAKNKDLRRLRRENTRKISRKSTMEDLFHSLPYSSDPYITTVANKNGDAQFNFYNKVNCCEDELLALLKKPDNYIYDCSFSIEEMEE